MVLTLNSFVGICDLVLENYFTVILILSGKNEIDETFLELIDKLEENFNKVKFGKISPLGMNEISAIKQFGMKELPGVLLFTCNDLKPFKTITGYNPSEIYSNINNLISITDIEIPDQNKKLKLLTEFKSMMVFMKGIKEEPFCRFAKGLVSLLDSINVKNYGHYNIFESEETRQALKKYHNWPTFPQICINGEFIGGLDILQEMNSKGELIKEIPKDAF